MVFRYRSGWQLGPFSADFPVGTVALIGPNGSGKSTLLRLLAGIRRAREGELLSGGEPVVTARQLSDHRRRVGYMPQGASWAKSWRCGDFLDYVAHGYGLPGSRLAEARDRALESTGMRNLAAHRLGSLSGGQRQRVFLAAALVHDPQILILDEPTVGLDPAERVRFRRMLHQQASERVVVISTHLMDDVTLSAQTVLVVRDGVLVWSGDVPGLQALAGAGSAGISAAEAGYLALLEA